MTLDEAKSNASLVALALRPSGVAGVGTGGRAGGAASMVPSSGEIKLLGQSRARETRNCLETRRFRYQSPALQGSTRHNVRGNCLLRLV